MVNTDYSKSAVNLISPEDAANACATSDVSKQVVRLSLLAELNKSLNEANAKLNETPESLALKAAQEKLEATTENQNVKSLQERIGNLCAEIKADAEKFSYQDLEHGWYAVKQAKKSISYSPNRVRDALPEYAAALITEIVDKGKLEGLLKGKLITNEQVEQCIGETKEVYAYIIKAGGING